MATKLSGPHQIHPRWLVIKYGRKTYVRKNITDHVHKISADHLTRFSYDLSDFIEMRKAGK